MSKPVEAAGLQTIRLKAGPHIDDDDWKTSEALKQHFAEARPRRVRRLRISWTRSV